MTNIDIQAVSVTPTKTPTRTPTVTPSITKSLTPTPTITRTTTQTPTPTRSVTPTITPTRTQTKTPTPTRTQTRTPTKTPTLTPTNTKSPTPTKSVTPTFTPTRTQTKTPTPTRTLTPTVTQTATPTKTPTPSVTPKAPPGPPASIVATANKVSGQVALSWTAPIQNGGLPVTDYKIYYKLISSSSYTLFNDTISTLLSGVVTGLTNGASYSFQVRAVNSAGEGSAITSTAVTPTSIPEAPVLNSAIPGNGSITLNWSAPNNNGSAIVDYVIEYKIGSSGTYVAIPHTASPLLSYIHKSLVNGSTYYYRIAAKNSVGIGPYSNELSATPIGIPSTPSNVYATSGCDRLYVNWSPSTGGGNNITYDLYVANDNTLLISTNLTSVNVSAPDAIYFSFYVIARNSVGSSLPSVNTTPIKTYDKPSSPISGSLQISNRNLILNWSAVSSASDYLIGYIANNLFNVIDSTINTSYNTNNDIIGPVVLGVKSRSSILAGGCVSNGTLLYNNGNPINTIPGTPSISLIPWSNNMLKIVITPPEKNGGSNITNYVVNLRLKEDGESSPVTDILITKTISDTMKLIPTYYTLPSNDINYSASVRAINSLGSSKLSEYTNYSKNTNNIINTDHVFDIDYLNNMSPPYAEPLLRGADRWNAFIKYPSAVTNYLTQIISGWNGLRLSQIFISGGTSNDPAASCAILNTLSVVVDDNISYTYPIDFRLRLFTNAIALYPDDLHEILTHELGHALGIGEGSLWKNNVIDHYLYGSAFTQTQEAYNSIVNDNIVRNLIPLEDTGGVGVADGHWSETFRKSSVNYPAVQDIMGPFFNTTSNIISLLSIKALVDQGFEEREPGAFENYPPVDRGSMIQSMGTDRVCCSFDPNHKINNIIVSAEDIPGFKPIKD